MGDGSSSLKTKSPIPDLNQCFSNKEHLARKYMSTEWTDEKHSMYLKSMEASFVKDLYNSFDLFGYQIKHPSDPRLSMQKQDAPRTSPGQFKVLRRGCWQRIKFERIKPQSVKADGPDVVLANPWIRHYGSSRGRGREIAASSTHHEKITLAADLSSYDSVEVTDQNFVAEEDMGEIANHKRIKMETSMAPIPINDQVVPSAEFSGPITLPINRVCKRVTM